MKPGGALPPGIFLPDKATTVSEIKNGEIVIEFDNPDNGDVKFFPTQESYRSAVIPFRSGPGVPPTFVPIQRIPGQRVHVDARTLKARVTDALGDAANRRILEDVQRAAAQHRFPWNVGGAKPDQEYSLHNAATLHNWLYWMSRHVEEGKAKLLQGELKKPQEYINGGDIMYVCTDPQVALALYGGVLRKPEEKAAAKAAS